MILNKVLSAAGAISFGPLPPGFEWEFLDLSVVAPSANANCIVSGLAGWLHLPITAGSFGSAGASFLGSDSWAGNSDSSIGQFIPFAIFVGAGGKGNNWHSRRRFPIRKARFACYSLQRLYFGCDFSLVDNALLVASVVLRSL